MSGEEHKQAKSWPYDPMKLSYKQWVALPEDERYEVLEELFSLEDAADTGPRDFRNNMHLTDGSVHRLLRQVQEEEKRTGVVIPGWIVLGEGRTLHRRLLRRDDEDRS